MWATYFVGMFMGIADLVPGVSGGTIAFIMGVYERLINAIKGVGTKNWDPKFLLPLIAGIATSIFTFSHLLESFLNDPVLRTYLYATFMGLILGSTLFCSKQIKEWSNSRIMAILFGIVVAFVFTSQVSLAQTTADNSTLWVLFCGAIAISAMLLPGVSGSYLLTILGIYPIVIQNLNVLTAGLASGNFEFASFQFMSTLLAGIVLGAIVFSRVVSWSLRNFHDMTIATLTGLMLGGLPTVWPFWVYENVPHLLKPEKGMVLIPKEMIFPDLTSQIFLVSVICVVAGFIWVILAEWVVARKTNDKASIHEPAP
jgi:putative membrane protein